MNTAVFVPQLKGGDGEDRKAAKAALRALFTVALRTYECAEAVGEFKANGLVHGHKVLDDEAAVQALVSSTSKELGDQVEAVTLTKYEKTQVLNQVLRREFEMVNGKLTGNAAKRLLKQDSQ